MRQLRTILLIDDDETTNYLNHRLLSRMNTAEDINFTRTFIAAKLYCNYSGMPFLQGASSCFYALRINYSHACLVLLCTCHKVAID